MQLLAQAAKTRNWFAVHFHLARLTESERSTPFIIKSLSNIAAERGEWQEALKENARLWPNGQGLLYDEMDRWLLLKAANQHQEAVKVAQVLLRRAKDSKEPIYDYVYWNLVYPRGADLAFLLDHATSDSKLSPEFLVAQLTLAMALYRNGQPTGSLEALKKAQQLQGSDSVNVTTMAFLALVHAKLTHPQEAAEWKGKAEGEIDRRLAQPVWFQEYPDWRERLTFEWLREEMEATINATPNPEPAPEQK